MDRLRDPQGLYTNTSISNMPPQMSADDMLKYLFECDPTLRIRIGNDSVWIYIKDGFLYADDLAGAFQKYLRNDFSYYKKTTRNEDTK